MSTVGALIHQGEVALAGTSSSARLDSEVLLDFALGRARSQLVARLHEACNAACEEKFLAYIERRKLGEPIAYIIGEREFFGLSFAVTPDVLIPRPESELVVEEALAFLRDRRNARILDLGTGSGCLAISIIVEGKKQGVEEIVCDAVDKSVQALDVAAINARRLGVLDAISFVEGDWCADSSKLSPPYDCIVANPPYIDPSEPTPVELSFEPPEALFSAGKGLRDTERIIREGLPLLKPGGVLLCEVGAGKRELLTGLLTEYNAQCEVTLLGDESNYDRFCVVRVRT